MKFKDLSEEDKEKARKKRRTKRRAKNKRIKEEKEKKWQAFFKSSKKEVNLLKRELESDKTFFCIDTEEYEFSKRLLEVGITIYKNGEIKTYHYVVKEAYNQRNKKFVPDNKDIPLASRIVGPSATGSENGIPNSIISAPPLTSESWSRTRVMFPPK